MLMVSGWAIHFRGIPFQPYQLCWYLQPYKLCYDRFSNQIYDLLIVTVKPKVMMKFLRFNL